MATRMTRCGFCRRLACELAEPRLANGEQKTETTGTSVDSSLLPDHTMIEETYCHDCERFYHQLLTFERGGGRYADDWKARDSSVQQLPQLRVITRAPL